MVNNRPDEIAPSAGDPAAAPALPPGPSLPTPLVVGRFVSQPTSFLSCERRYGEYFTLRLSAGRTMVITSDPAAVKTVFTGDPEQLLAGKNNEILQPLLGDRSVLLLDRSEHLRQRRLMLPPFHGERMKAYAETMREVAERQIAAWPRGVVLRCPLDAGDHAGDHPAHGLRPHRRGADRARRRAAAAAARRDREPGAPLRPAGDEL